MLTRDKICEAVRAVAPYNKTRHVLGDSFRSWHSRGYIPHFDIPDLVQSVTFRLHDSLPEHVIAAWKEELGLLGASLGARTSCPHGAQALPAFNLLRSGQDVRAPSILRERISDYEDAGHGECFLKNREIAAIVQDALLYFDGERYRLLDWCIMPNHVHVLIEINDRYSLSDIVRSWKSFTAKKANAVLGRKGDFWMPDYYDRFIRNEEHLAVVSVYIRENPVRCGLVKNAEDWEFGSAAGSVPGSADILSAWN